MDAERLRASQASLKARYKAMRMANEQCDWNITY